MAGLLGPGFARVLIVCTAPSPCVEGAPRRGSSVHDRVVDKDPVGPARSYFVCATPRTGSSLLCALLGSSGVAGRPQSYFRQPDEPAFAAQWGLPRTSDGARRYGDFVRAALRAGRTENGVFAARIMGGTLGHLLARLGQDHPALAGRDLDLLQQAFGRLRFVHLWRRDVVGQAVSWFRAEQTGVWHRTAPSVERRPDADARYDFHAIADLVRTIEDHNDAWRAWFRSVGVEPYEVAYEDLDAAPVEAARGVLEFLQLEVPAGRPLVAPHRRLRDARTVEWIARYRAEVHA